ncbi:hypothetical protein G7046_g8698 [Stylonectria norvegica]|nr:hypothetical protein G7046_g8698 [Stylonectria norvegica]
MYSRLHNTQSIVSLTRVIAINTVVFESDTPKEVPCMDLTRARNALTRSRESSTKIQLNLQLYILAGGSGDMFPRGRRARDPWAVPDELAEAWLGSSNSDPATWVVRESPRTVEKDPWDAWKASGSTATRENNAPPHRAHMVKLPLGNKAALPFSYYVSARKRANSPTAWFDSSAARNAIADLSPRSQGTPSRMSSERLNVIALISGGKDSFFSLLHCIEHGHRVVALANLFPGAVEAETPATVAASTGRSRRQGEQGLEAGGEGQAQGQGQSQAHIRTTATALSQLQQVDPAIWASGLAGSKDHAPDAAGEPSDWDLNSFMYQTVGHEVLPLYAAATGLPLYRQPIRGRAVRHERDYDATTDDAAARPSNEGEGEDEDEDETESMLPLLRAVMARHPEANALCAGAILSTYQRTRVESIAMRLGLTPLAYLWQYPVLPPPSAGAVSETQLLSDMASAGLEARIIKVASAGLGEDHLWERVSSEAGAARVRSALRKFGGSEGAAALGEGGEFETIVLDGPASLFSKRISIPEEERKIVREGGGCSWLMLRGARLEDKLDPVQECAVRTPDLLDPRFKAIVDDLPSHPWTKGDSRELGPAKRSSLLSPAAVSSSTEVDLVHWAVLAEPSNSERSIQEETIQVVDQIQALLSSSGLEASHITNTIIALRRMSDFPKVNGEYGKLFPKPNPPARVTVSCGDLLPVGCNIAVYLTAPSSSEATDRNGLHVQSRSYWAPANIGPYSQASDIPITVQQRPTGLRAVAVAGQIPLIPATMLLPTLSDTSQGLQIVLSLQHLWRIGVDLKIQLWTSVVAYFPRSTAVTNMERNAKVAGHVWKAAHGSPDDEDDAGDGPDPWDLKYNTDYMSLVNKEQQGAQRSLPDWSAATLRQQNNPETWLPPMFAVEVEELPRQSGVEWHAHTGISRVDDCSAELIFYPEVGVSGWQAWHCIVKTGDVAVVYTTLACRTEQNADATKFDDLSQAMNQAYEDSLRLLESGEPASVLPKPYLLYVDAIGVDSPWAQTQGLSDGLAIIPCRSIWSAHGQRTKIVALYESILHLRNGDLTI